VTSYDADTDLYRLRYESYWLQMGIQAQILGMECMTNTEPSGRSWV
jgi:hypothetical protein